MVYLSFRATLFDQAQGLRTIFGVVSAQIYFTAWQALPVITVVACATGAIVIMQSSFQMSLLGAGGDIVGKVLVIAIIREIGPLLTALIVIARSGTAVASELGTLKANREIEALETMGINPLSYIVFPRILGGMLSVLCLAFFFDITALFGGYLVSALVQDRPFYFFVDSLAAAFQFEDMWLFLLKNGFSGLIIFVISCSQGLKVKQSLHEVPQVTSKAVVNSLAYVIAFHLIVSLLFYLNQLSRLGVI